MFQDQMILADGTPADPPTFTSSEPNWRVGDVAMVRPGVEFRIVGLQQADWNEPPTWIVEPVGKSD